MTKFFRGLLVAGLLPLGLVLASCGDGGAAAPSADPPATAPGTPTGTPGETPATTPSATPSGTPSGSPTMTTTPTAGRKPKPPPTQVTPQCSGTFKGGTFTVRGNAGVSIINGAFSCGGGKLVDVQRMRTAVRFVHGGKSVTVGPRKTVVFAGYQIRVGLANSKQATFTATLG